MRTIDIATVLHPKETHEENTKDPYHGHAGEVFPQLARTSIATDNFDLLSPISSVYTPSGRLTRDSSWLSLPTSLSVMIMAIVTLAAF